jgi:restriction system protein
VKKRLQELGAANTRVSIRDFLALFGQERRAKHVVSAIESQLFHAGVITEPDFRHAHIDSLIRLAMRPAPVSETTDSSLAPPEMEPDAEPGSYGLRVRAIASAVTSELVTVQRNDTVKLAITRMIAGDFSQLVVLNGKSYAGVVTWETIGRARINITANSGPNELTVGSAMVVHPMVDVEDDLLGLVAKISEQGAVVVRNPSQQHQPVGIVTTSDLAHAYSEAALPFFVLQELETSLTGALNDGVVTQDDLRDRFEVDTVEDLSLGQKRTLISDEAVWAGLSWDVDKSEFLSLLENVNTLRNKVMHFRTDKVEAPDLSASRAVLDILRAILR